ncbi:hypothetical protein CDD82_4407 [Ophiocordyceps australis]|uniref:TFIIS-type domain-containing protein n=1 Tax=Ophiocordyceps australis TaxID=1399860 RepID=A0A2C5Z6W4_9HYPO|nr:hypothetical protein CDD82_4407 [Ophiocordyceps australis]
MNKDIGAKKAVSCSKPTDFPSFLRQKLQSNVQSVQRHTISSGTAASESCPKCGGSEVKYTAVQLRSADEGSTIIYTCACGNSWHENN